MKYDVQMETVASLMVAAGSEEFMACLCYSQRDPFAVTIRLAQGTGWVDWVFARDLLADGLIQQTGEGDVVISPASADEVQLLVRSPNGRAVVRLDTDFVEEFLHTSRLVVPRGQEHRFFDVDVALADLGAKDAT